MFLHLSVHSSTDHPKAKGVYTAVLTNLMSTLPAGQRTELSMNDGHWRHLEDILRNCLGTGLEGTPLIQDSGYTYKVCWFRTPGGRRGRPLPTPKSLARQTLTLGECTLWLACYKRRHVVG